MRALKATAGLVRRARLAARYWMRLRYTWRLAWVKAEGR